MNDYYFNRGKKPPNTDGWRHTGDGIYLKKSIGVEREMVAYDAAVREYNTWNRAVEAADSRGDQP